MLKKLERYLPFILFLIITLFVGFPLFREKLLNGHDAVFQLFRCYSTKVALQEKQFIPMINPNMIGGFGYGINIFYGTLTTYLVTLLSIFIKPIGLSINLVILIIIFLSGLFMYFFIKDISNSKKTGMIAAILYMTNPYLLYDIYVRMALGEIISFVFLPLLFYGLYNIIYQDKKMWYLLTIGTAGLFLSHTVSTLMIAIFALLFVLLNYKAVFKKETIKKLIIALGLAVILSLPTILPLLEAKLSSDYMVFDSDYMRTTGIRMEEQALHLFTKDIPSQIVTGYVILIGIITIYLIKRKGQVSKINNQCLILTIISILLTLPFIPWSKLPNILSIFQFPWRFLMISSFFLASVIALLYEQIFSKKVLRYIPLILCFIFVIPFLNLGIINKGVDNNLVNSNKLKKRGDIVRSTGSASAEYLPRNAIYKCEYLSHRTTNPIILDGKGTISNIEKKGTQLSFQIEVNEESIVELPYIYYLGYIVKNENENIKTIETKNGLVGINLEIGIYDIKSYYRGSDIMIFSYTSFMIGVIIFIIMIIKEKKNKNEIK